MLLGRWAAAPLAVVERAPTKQQHCADAAACFLFLHRHKGEASRGAPPADSPNEPSSTKTIKANLRSCSASLSAPLPELALAFLGLQSAGVATTRDENVAGSSPAPPAVAVALAFLGSSGAAVASAAKAVGPVAALGVAPRLLIGGFADPLSSSQTVVVDAGGGEGTVEGFEPSVLAPPLAGREQPETWIVQESWTRYEAPRWDGQGFLTLTTEGGGSSAAHPHHHSGSVVVHEPSTVAAEYHHSYFSVADLATPVCAGLLAFSSALLAMRLLRDVSEDFGRNQQANTVSSGFSNLLETNGPAMAGEELSAAAGTSGVVASGGRFQPFTGQSFHLQPQATSMPTADKYSPTGGKTHGRNETASVSIDSNAGTRLPDDVSSAPDVALSKEGTERLLGSDDQDQTSPTSDDVQEAPEFEPPAGESEQQQQ